MTPNLLHSLLILHDEFVLRETIRANLIDWATDVMTPSGLALSAHHRFLLSNLDLIVKGDVKRLIVLMPPGSAKSTYVPVNSDLWGVYAPTPAAAGTWYAWAEGIDGSAPTVYPTPFTVT
jgi:hypothetical protein